MSGKRALVKSTKEFFQKHWYLKEAPPEWSFTDRWQGPVPNYKLSGVYVLFNKQELVYIGRGLSRSEGRYIDRGISKRLMAHVLKAGQLRSRWKEEGVTSMATLGFPKDENYLALALERYLIDELRPQCNKR